NATPGLYRPQSTPRFFEEMLTQVTGLCALSQENTSAINALLVTVSDGKPAIRAATGKFAGLSLPEHAEVEKLLQACAARMPENKEPVEIPSKFTLVPLVVRDRNIGFICLENAAHLCKTVQDLVQVMANQCASALENLQLYEDLKEANRQALYMLAVASEYKDEDTGTHVKRMAYHTTRIALEMGIPAQEAEACGQACMLHDIGKIGIPDAILQKPGELNQAEMEKIKTHCSLGAKILRNNKWFNLARDIAYRHHEWWDGNGYPEGIQGEEIPLAARIVAVTDVFDALTHKRPYKDAWPVDKAVEKIKQGANTHFDPKVVAAFLRTLK
ncbi:MAG: HD domain-containing protein, partial [Gammaproteobacteria bacterium]|nr:HD domain-containing protein [Gammaproteobacteria bacterium]